MNRMKTRIFLLLSLAPVILAACAPASRPAGTDAVETPTEPPAVVAATETPGLVSEAPTQAALTEEPAATALPVATSRGPDLHASDPGLVSLASGGLQFVEFFRFT
jgi:hypothetical protein